MEEKYDKIEIKKIKQKLRDSLNDIRMNETISKEQPHFSSKESSNILKEIKVKKKLLDTLDTEFSFGEKHMSLISFLFNKQISQKYLNALKYFILHESLEKQNEINTILVDSIIELIKQSEDKSKINIENILTRLEKIEKHLSK